MEFKDEVVVPIFISCDPKRDSLKTIKEYLKGMSIMPLTIWLGVRCDSCLAVDFHPDFIGMTGTYGQIKRVAKSYRLYFSAPPRAVDDDESDYLVDHSIFFYLMDPQGKYAAHFGKQETAESVTEKIKEILSKKDEK
jgi:protein SCO1/2